jgi:tight adherence protein C
MSQETLIILLAFGSISVMVYFVSLLLFKDGGDDKLRSRLQGKSESSASVVKKDAPVGTNLFKQLRELAAKPFMPSTREKQSSLQRELAKAGVYSPAALRTVQGSKVIGIAMGLIFGYAAGWFLGSMFLYLAIGGLVGYAAPILWLRLKVKNNQKQLEYGLPDALDLMVVCVEAGMTVDSAMQRVGEELALVHPAISREFGIAHMQTRVGMPRAEALRNLGGRTSNASMISLSAMLNQAERFGTSIAQALRVHAESLRIARQHKAEELAAKSVVKMSFPLVLFIFPATFIVLLGPVMIQLMNSELMK